MSLPIFSMSPCESPSQFVVPSTEPARHPLEEINAQTNSVGREKLSPPPKPPRPQIQESPEWSGYASSNKSLSSSESIISPNSENSSEFMTLLDEIDTTPKPARSYLTEELKKHEEDKLERRSVVVGLTRSKRYFNFNDLLR